MKTFFRKHWFPLILLALTGGFFAHHLVMSHITPLPQGFQPFETAAFERDLNAGRPLAVHIFAGWCITCRIQKDILETAARDVPGIHYYVVDYDRQPAAREYLGQPAQSTLLLYKNGRLHSRMVPQPGEKGQLQVLLRNLKT